MGSDVSAGEALYVADELFFTGTATEVMPIRSLDRITIADGKRGPITERIQRRYQDIINGRAEDVHGWLSYRA
jgi:branched-chain amino acid aminotransferase